ncbi:competence protein CoiA [Haloplasma contractile]|uniref:Competence protein n=1 Tax=Haloplasma contractile SSD-17B TaxID=1033810 RepID=U2FF70_9MOLU|nr:competence protein CoiA family protein [Haloplasma contractile]ERJ11560.1 Competence protein [Haloplasma contractile SSD-17B]
MFKAKTSKGVIVDIESINTVSKTSQRYNCPYCNHEVIIRAGDKYRKHFSHKNADHCNYERESIRHYEGKLTLYRWLINQTKEVDVEYYLKAINRIADLYVRMSGKKYVIELQCSQVKPDVILKRTADYNRLGIDVIWIIYKEHVKFKKNRKLTEFEIACMKHDQIVYMSETSIFIYRAVMNSSSNTFNGMWIKRHLNDLIIDNLLDRNDVTNTMNWVEVKQTWRLKDCLYFIKYNRMYANFVYNNGFQPSLFPVEIGIPIKEQYLIKMNPFVWQSYIYIYIFIFEQIDWYDVFRYCRNKFCFRTTDEHKIMNLIREYLNYLIKRECIQILDNVIYRKEMKHKELNAEEALENDQKWNLKVK